MKRTGGFWSDPISLTWASTRSTTWMKSLTQEPSLVGWLVPITVSLGAMPRAASMQAPVILPKCLSSGRGNSPSLPRSSLPYTLKYLKIPALKSEFERATSRIIPSDMYLAFP